MAHWVSHQIWGEPPAFGEYEAMGVRNVDGATVAGVVFHNYDKNAGVVEITGAAVDRRWFSRTVANYIFGYVFDILECQMAYARHRKTNTAAIRLWGGLGAEQVLIPRMYGRDQDGVIATLTDDAWRMSRMYKEAA